MTHHFRLTVPVSISFAPDCPAHAVITDNKGEIILSIISILHGDTVAQARRKLQARLFDDLRELVAYHTNGRRLLIGTVDGSLILVEWRYGRWVYSIINPDQPPVPSYIDGANNFEEVCEMARCLAISTCDGIAWEIPI